MLTGIIPIFFSEVTAMYITYEISHGPHPTLTAAVFGEIDHHSASKLRRELDAAIAREAPETLVLVLSGVDFMDSSGLGLVMGRLRTMQQRGGNLIIRDPNDDVARILDMAGMENFIRIERSGKNV